MIKKVYRGKIILYVDEKEIRPGQTFRAFSTSGRRYFVDTSGNVYMVEPETGETLLKKICFPHKNGVPYINFRSTKRKQEWVVAKALFREMMQPDRIGHFDGDPKNCAVTNLYLDITKDPPDKFIQITTPGGKSMVVTDEEFGFLKDMTAGSLLSASMAKHKLSTYDVWNLLDRFNMAESRRSKKIKEANDQWKGLERSRLEDSVRMFREKGHP